MKPARCYSYLDICPKRSFAYILAFLSSFYLMIYSTLHLNLGFAPSNFALLSYLLFLSAMNEHFLNRYQSLIPIGKQSYFYYFDQTNFTAIILATCFISTPLSLLIRSAFGLSCLYGSFAIFSAYLLNLSLKLELAFAI